jgi:DNA repair exonuclease SbcCD ATPase subunit
MESESYLPDEAPGQLVQIDAMMDDRRNRLEEVKQKRRVIREKAEQLPVSRRLLDLQGRIAAAAEQATWVEALEEQIDRLDNRIEKARKQLESDAERLGMDEEDCLSLMEGDLSQLPDLSKQTLSALAGPAKAVKEQNFLLKQARGEAADHKARADSLAESLRETLDKANATNLQQAIRQHTESITTLRHRVQLGEHLDKLKRHYRDLEKETVNLTTAEALPVDRLILLAVPFIVGGMALIYGLANVFGFTWLVTEPDPTWGMLCILFGFMSLLTYYFGRENGQRSTTRDREDCERQIDTLRRQIREVESERNDIDSTLPTSKESLELRVRETEMLLAELEAALPTYHNHEAALQSYKAARERANTAAGGVKDAKRQWSATLERLGLSDSMSPSSVRNLSEGYETLQTSRRRLDELQAERDQRRRERQAIAKRIESLYLEAWEVNHGEADDDEDVELMEEREVSRAKSRTSPLDQLNHLQEEISRQQHWIKRRRELKEQDLQLKRQQSAHHRAIERGEQQRRGLWAKCGVATSEQFYEMVDTKARLVDFRKQHADLEKQIRSMVGTHIEYDDVEQEMDGASASDLEKRWESLTTRMAETETRVALLRTQQGELAQEMKHLGDDSRLSVAQLELGCVERKIESVGRRWQTLAMASCLLEDVCGTFERERQPETLREASTFLNQLTDGKYERIWTPLGTNQLKIDDGAGKSLPLEVLSRGTREAVFIALRLSLAAAYARRGVMLPLVLDDVLVNFDRDRAMHAARTLKTFAELGHQVMMFTCHEHIVDIFHDIDVQVRLMPAQGQPGRATILEAETEAVYEEEYEEEVEEKVVEEPVEELVEEEIIEEQIVEPEPESVVETEPEIVYVEKPKRKKKRKIEYIEVSEPEPPREDLEPAIGWAWFERGPMDRLGDVEDALASITSDDWRDDDVLSSPDEVPEDIWNRNGSWWGDNHPDDSQTRAS